MAVLATGDEFKVLSRNSLPGEHKATPVPVDGAFYIRTTEGLFCIREGGKE